MALETTKAHAIRLVRGDFTRYLGGEGIDIGCGPDPLKVSRGTVRPWDVADGDAQALAGVADCSFDFVYASHSLEHMRDIPAALGNWVRVLRPGGYLYFTVPDYTLYEHHRWPSRFNPDHKHSFSLWLSRQRVQRDTHWQIGVDLIPVLSGLGVETISASVEDDGYDYNLGSEYDQTQGPALAQICLIGRRYE